MTFNDAMTAVKNITKAGRASDNTDTRDKVNDLVIERLTSTYANMVRSRLLSDFRVNRSPLDLSLVLTNGVASLVASDYASAQIVPIPGGIEEVRFSSGNKEWVLPELNQRIPPAGILGKPKAYREIKSYNPPATFTLIARLYLDPFVSIDTVNDKCYITYYQIPLAFTYTSSAISTSTTQWSGLDGELIDRVAADIFMYYGNVDKAKFLLQKWAPAQPANQQ